MYMPAGVPSETPAQVELTLTYYFLVVEHKPVTPSEP